MALMKWEPFRNFEKIFEEFPVFPLLPTFKGTELAVDLYEEKGKLIAELIVPGMAPEQIEVTFQNGNLKIVGKTEAEKELKEKEFYLREIHRGAFERLVELPLEVLPEKVEAVYKNGVLKVIMPIKEGTPKQRVKVQIQ